jgi:hypothetical protein
VVLITVRVGIPPFVIIPADCQLAVANLSAGRSGDDEGICLTPLANAMTGMNAHCDNATMPVPGPLGSVISCVECVRPSSAHSLCTCSPVPTMAMS